MDVSKLLKCSVGSVLLGDGIDRVEVEKVPGEVEILNTDVIHTQYESYFAFSRMQLEQMVANFDKKSLGREVPINRDHPRTRIGSTEAYGWIKGLSVWDEEENGKITRSKLIATIDWTEEGKKLVASGKYKYVSIGAMLDRISHMDGKTKEGMVLFEVSLTNDPAFLTLPEIMGDEVALFSEIVQNGVNLSKQKGESEMEELLELKKKLAEKEGEVATLSAKLTKSEADQANAESEFEKLKVELAEKNRVIELSKREVELDRLVLAKKMTPAQKEAAVKLDAAAYKGFIQAIELSPGDAYASASGSVQLSRTLSEEGSEGADPDEVLLNRARELVKKDSDLTMTEAMENVMKGDATLAKKVNQKRLEL